MNKTFFKKLLISHLLICMCFISIFITYGYSENLDEDIKPQTINRVSGKTRYETAANLSRKFTEADNIILVSGEDFPDALVSSSIAFSLKAPILLTSKDNIPNETLEEINRLNPTNIYIVGGEGSIHSESLKSLDKNLIRISGEDRFETSEKVAEKAIELGLSNDTLIVTGGLSYPDALSSSNLVKDKNSPLVLVRNNLPEIAKDKNLIAVGGIKNMELENFNGEIISGKDRYETSVRVLQSLNNDFSNLLIASGENYPDALVASAIENPLLLTKKNGYSLSSLDFIKENKIKDFILVGGLTNLPESLVDQLIGLDDDNFKNVKLPEKMPSNHNGKIMVLTMHDVSDIDNAYNRTPEALKADLLNLYKKGYLPISLREYIDNDINIPEGYSPYVIVLDDGTLSKFEINEDGSISERCAFGVFKYIDDRLEGHKTKATFFISGKVPFKQENLVQKKFDLLLENEMDIGNHTLNHVNLSKNPQLIEKEIALQKQNLESYLPDDYEVNLFAIPFSTHFTKKDKSKIFQGEYNGIKYKNIGVAEGGWKLSEAPQNMDFDNTFIPRIPISRSNNFDIPTELYDFLDYLDKNPNKRYVK